MEPVVPVMHADVAGATPSVGATAAPGVDATGATAIRATCCHVSLARLLVTILLFLGHPHKHFKIPPKFTRTRVYATQSSSMHYTKELNESI